VLQCVQCAAVSCRELACGAMSYTVLQCVAVCNQGCQTTV